MLHTCRRIRSRRKSWYMPMAILIYQLPGNSLIVRYHSTHLLQPKVQLAIQQIALLRIGSQHHNIEEEAFVFMGKRYRGIVQKVVIDYELLFVDLIEGDYSDTFY